MYMGIKFGNIIRLKTNAVEKGRVGIVWNKKDRQIDMQNNKVETERTRWKSCSNAEH